MLLVRSFPLSTLLLVVQLTDIFLFNRFGAIVLVCNWIFHGNIWKILYRFSPGNPIFIFAILAQCGDPFCCFFFLFCSLCWLEINVGNQDKYTTYKNSGSWQLCHAVEEKLVAGWMNGWLAGWLVGSQLAICNYFNMFLYSLGEGIFQPYYLPDPHTYTIHLMGQDF